jgi:hypothetical protein
MGGRENVRLRLRYKDPLGGSTDKERRWRVFFVNESVLPPNPGPLGYTEGSAQGSYSETIG